METSTFHIGIAGPVATDALSDFLNSDLEHAPKGLGGTGLCTLVRGLLERGHHVTVCSLDRSVDRSITLEGDLLTLHYGPYRQRHRMRDGMLVERRAIRDLLRGAQPDIVNAHWAYEFALGALASGYPTIVTVRDWAPTIVRYSPIPYWLARQFMYFRAIRRADGLTAVSPYLCRKLEKVTGRPVTLIPNAVPSSRLSDTVREPNPEGQILLSVNNQFSALKNVAALIEAFAMVKRARPAATLLLVGSAYGEGGEAQRWAGKRGLAGGIEFLGNMSNAQLYELLDHVDVLVHPSREEAFGMTLIEAMARGTPVVAGHASGAVPWVLDNGKAGVLTDVSSPLELAASVLALLEDPSLWRYYSDAGHRRAAEHFSGDHVIDQYLQAYMALISRVVRGDRTVTRRETATCGNGSSGCADPRPCPRPLS